jgi:membrane protease YdiL (CAAX protease family)
MLPYQGEDNDMQGDSDFTNSHSLKGKALKQDANIIGLVMIALVAMLQFVFVLILLVLQGMGQVDLTSSDPYYGLSNSDFLVTYGVAYAFSLGVPAPLIFAITRRHIRPFFSSSQKSEKTHPIRFVSMLLGLLAGLAICVLANIATSYILFFLQQFGIETPVFPSYMEDTPVSLFLNVLVFAMLPAIFEEMVFRGYFLKMLRAYGDGFAIGISALLFALLHGNILQIPFTFIVGIACGYLVVRTGYVWPAIALHFLTNFMATILDYITSFVTPIDQAQQVIVTTYAIIGMLGLSCLLTLLARNNPLVQRHLSATKDVSTGKKVAVLFTSVVFVISMALTLSMTIVSVMEG